MNDYSLLFRTEIENKADTLPSAVFAELKFTINEDDCLNLDKGCRLVLSPLSSDRSASYKNHLKLIRNQFIPTSEIFFDGLMSCQFVLRQHPRLSFPVIELFVDKKNDQDCDVARLQVWWFLLQVLIANSQLVQPITNVQNNGLKLNDTLQQLIVGMIKAQDKLFQPIISKTGLERFLLKLDSQSIHPFSTVSETSFSLQAVMIPMTYAILSHLRLERELFYPYLSADGALKQGMAPLLLENYIFRAKHAIYGSALPQNINLNTYKITRNIPLNTADDMTNYRERVYKEHFSANPHAPYSLKNVAERLMAYQDKAQKGRIQSIQ